MDQEIRVFLFSCRDTEVFLGQPGLIATIFQKQIIVHEKVISNRVTVHAVLQLDEYKVGKRRINFDLFNRRQFFVQVLRVLDDLDTRLVECVAVLEKIFYESLSAGVDVPDRNMPAETFQKRLIAGQSIADSEPRDTQALTEAFYDHKVWMALVVDAVFFLSR
jgi:hypothetical protein